MATRSNNKQIKVVADTDFNNNKIINAKISGSDNLITGVNKVDDVKVNNTSILQSKVANINFAENCNNIQTTVQEGSIYTDFKGIGIIKNSYKIGDPNTEIQQSGNTLSFPESEHISTGTLIFKNGTLLNFSTEYTIIASNCINLIETPVTNDIISVINGLSILSKISNINDNKIVCEDFINNSTLVFKNGKLLSNVGDQKDYTITGNTITFTLNLNTSDIIVLIKSVTNSDTFSEQYGKFLEYEGPYDNLVFKNGNFLAKDIDYQVELLGTNHYRLNFITALTTTDVIRLIYNELNSIYTLLGDKQNSLPTYQSGKILSNDGNKLTWINMQTNLPSQSGQSGKFLTTNGSTISWGAVPQGTVTSTRVRAGLGLYSSQSTAQATALDTTISIAAGYKLPTITEWSGKQDALPTQSGQSGKFLTTNGRTISWATVDALPSQADNAGKFLTTDGTTASWIEINVDTTITYFDSSNWILDDTDTVLSTGLNLGNKVSVFKDGLLLQPGYLNTVTSLVGSPNIVNGISSDMNSSNYIRFLGANYLKDNDWEVCLKIYWDGSSEIKYLTIADYTSRNYLRIGSTGGFTFNGYTAENSQIWVHSSAGFYHKPAGWYYIALKYTYDTGDFAIYSGTTLENMVRNAHTEKGEHKQLRDLTSSTIYSYAYSQSPAQIDLRESYVQVGDIKYIIASFNDYTVNGNNILFANKLESTDKIAVVNGNMNPVQNIGYNTFSNKSISSSDWIADTTYTGYNYKCNISCSGVTPTMYSQVTFAPEQFDSGNYANISKAGNNFVTIYSKVAESITIPVIMVLGA